jgi:predicted dehydrogenase
MIAVLGSGFGLYGYLPALAGLAGRQVLLPLRYRPRFEARQELACFASKIVWVATDEEALDRAEAAVIALRPEQQPGKVEDCLRRPNIRRLILEKPLAASEPEASALLDRLRQAGRPFRMGYTLRLTPWADRLRRQVASAVPSHVEVDWRFRAHHFRHNVDTWKRSAEVGGGPLRFFGIHLLALFAELGYRRVHTATLDERRWIATLDGPGGQRVEIAVDSDADVERFAVSAGEVLIDGKGPFDDVPELTAFPGNDRRVPLLHRLFESFAADDTAEYRIYAHTQALWRQAEAQG